MPALGVARILTPHDVACYDSEGDEQDGREIFHQRIENGPVDDRTGICVDRRNEDADEGVCDADTDEGEGYFDSRM